MTYAALLQCDRCARQAPAPDPANPPAGWTHTAMAGDLCDTCSALPFAQIAAQFPK